MSLEVFRFVLSLAAEFKWIVGQMDVESAFLQALGFSRRIYVRPPREANTPDILWLLELPAYGLTESGRLWFFTSDKELIKSFGLVRSSLDYSLYFSKDASGSLDFVLAVQVDNYMYAGTRARIDAFESFLSSRFDVGTFERGTLSLMGCTITQDPDSSVHLTQDDSLQQLRPEMLLDCIGAKGDRPASARQATIYRHVIGKMLYIGRLSAPLVLLHASLAASKLVDLHTRHLRALASVLKRLQGQGATLHFLSPPRCASSRPPPVLDVLSDGAMAQKGEDKGREGTLVFRRFDDDIVHPIHWTARHLWRVSRSSTTAETLSAAEAVSNGLYLKALISSITLPPPTELTIDSSSLQTLSTSVKEPEEKLNKVGLASIREAYDDGELAAVHWCPGPKLLPDAFTKDNPATAKLLLHALSSGRHSRPAETKTNLGPSP